MQPTWPSPGGLFRVQGQVAVYSAVMAIVTGLRNHTQPAGGVRVRRGEQCTVPDDAVAGLVAGGIIEKPAAAVKKTTAAKKTIGK